jgi:hypothetical protein
MNGQVSATANALMNLLMLRDVSRTLGLDLSRHSYFTLIFPAMFTLRTVYVPLVPRHGFGDYCCPGSIPDLTVATLAVGLDSADRLRARSGWNQVRGMLGLR